MGSLFLIFVGLCCIQRCVLCSGLEPQELDVNSLVVKKILAEAEPRFQKLYAKSNLTKRDRFVRFTGEAKSASMLGPVYKVNAVFADTVCEKPPQNNETCEFDKLRPLQVVSIETILKRNRISKTYFVIEKIECFIPGLENCDFTQDEIINVLEQVQGRFDELLDFDYVTRLSRDDIKNVQKEQIGDKEIKYVITTKFAETECLKVTSLWSVFPPDSVQRCPYKGKLLDVVVEAIVNAGKVQKVGFEFL